jgi:hypothetical protein
MSERRAQIHTEHGLSKTRRCELLGVARSTAYYRRELVSEEDLVVMRLIDEIHLRLPFYGSRRIRDELEEHGHTVNRKRVQRLMRLMELRALYPRRRTSQPGKGHKIYPYRAPVSRRHPGRCCRGASMSGMHPNLSKDEMGWMPAICYEMARAEAAVTFCTLGG